MRCFAAAAGSTTTLALFLALCQRAVCQEGPFRDEVWTATSKDGREWTIAASPVAKHASVPDVVEGEGGKLHLYAVNFADRPGPGQEGLAVWTSDDGKTWSKPRNVTIRKKPNKGAAVDPSVVRLDDGRFRMYFFGSEAARGDPAAQPGLHRICSAVSKDGVEFECEEGVRFELERITDPEVLKVGDGWYMFLSRGPETLVATSRDGLKFEKLDRVFRGGVPGAVAVEGGIRVYTSTPDGIVTWFWDLKGEPRQEGIAIPRGEWKIAADPAVMRRSNAGFFMVFKRSPR